MEDNQLKQDTWAGAFKEFFSQLGSVLTLLILIIFVGQACNIIDIYRILDK